MKKVLITAGPTVSPIDQVRVITNIFTGRTGINIAKYFAQKNYEVTLLIPNPNVVKMFNFWITALSYLTLFMIRKKPIRVITFLTFDDLFSRLKEEVINGKYDIIIHSAAINDYHTEGVYIKNNLGQLEKIDSSTKISSSHKELFLKSIPAPKMIDQIRNPWGFKGVLVKFKLQVGISDQELINIAQDSRNHSDADLIVANCLEWSNYYAYIIDRKNNLIKTSRLDLPTLLRKEIEKI